MPKYNEHITIDGVRYEARLTAKRIVVTNGETRDNWTTKRGKVTRSVEAYWPTQADEIYDEWGKREGYINICALYDRGLPGSLRLKDAENASAGVAERIREVFRLRAEALQREKAERAERVEIYRRLSIERVRISDFSKLTSQMGRAAKDADYDRVQELAREYHELAQTPIDYGEKS